MRQDGWAKRAAPRYVIPIVYQGIEYRALHSKMGYVEARDVETGERLWKRRIYNERVKPWLEADVQWVFITDLKIQNGKLVVTNKNGNRYIVNPKTGEAIEHPSSWHVWAVGLEFLVVILMVVWFVKRREISPNQSLHLTQPSKQYIEWIIRAKERGLLQKL
jgi:outer membrane protein assembly factor BamB